MVRVVCFDVGGVLIRITHHWRTAAARAGLEVGAELSCEATLTDAPMFEAFQRGEASEDHYLEALAAFLGGISKAEALSVHNHIMLEPYPGVEGLVGRLNQAGLLTGCLSNTNAPHWCDMFHSGRFPANEQLTIRLASHAVGLEKPDPRIYHRFEDRCGAQGAEIAFFDDSPANVASAAEIGWQSWLIDPGQPTVPQIVRHLGNVGIALEMASLL